MKIRHVFPDDTILPSYEYLTIFGGGLPNLPGINWQVASTGTLSLNNSSDSVGLFDANGVIVDDVVFGSEAGKDQSIVRNPEGTKGEWIQHLNLDNADGRSYSAGYLINEAKKENATVPEANSLFLLTITLPFVMFYKTIKR